MRLPDTSQPIQVSGTQKAAYGFELCSAAFEALSSTIYSYLVIAIIREYVANAIDANKAAGRGHIPIEVSLPNALNPSFTVSDNGFGLSIDQMWQVFAVFFKTTKNACDESIGGFGLGAKCALYYSRSFTITSVHDGIKSVYCSYINEENIPDLVLNHSAPSNEPSGLTINVPVVERDFVKFSREAAIILSMFETKPIVHTEGFEFAYDDIHEQIAEHGFAMINRHNRSDLYSDETAYALVGGVIYPLPPECEALRSTNFNYMVTDNRSIVIPFAINQVPPVLSREKIKVNDDVVALIDAKISSIVRGYMSKLQDRINERPSILTKMDVIGELVGFDAARKMGLKIGDKLVYTISNRTLSPLTILKCKPNDVSTVVLRDIGRYGNTREVLRVDPITIKDLTLAPRLVFFYRAADNKKTKYVSITKKYIRDTFQIGHHAVIIDPTAEVEFNEHMISRLQQYFNNKCEFLEYDEYNGGYYNPPTKRTSTRTSRAADRGTKSAETLYCRYTDEHGMRPISHHELSDEYQYLWHIGIDFKTCSDMAPEGRKPLRIILRNQTNAKRLDALGIKSYGDYLDEVATHYTDFKELLELESFFNINVNTNQVTPHRDEDIFKNCSEMRIEMRKFIRRFKKLHHKYRTNEIFLNHGILKRIPESSLHRDQLNGIFSKYRPLADVLNASERVKMRLKLKEQSDKIAELQKKLNGV